jgi:hypothetical protein
MARASQPQRMNEAITGLRSEKVYAVGREDQAKRGAVCICSYLDEAKAWHFYADRAEIVDTTRTPLLGNCR